MMDPVDQLTAHIKARDAEIIRLRAEVAALRLSLGEHVPDATVEPIGCPAPGACMTVAEITRLRARVAWLERAITEDEVHTANIKHWSYERESRISAMRIALTAALAVRMEKQK